MVQKGTSESGPPIISNFSGRAVVNVVKPVNTLPSPIYIKPKTGISVPPIIKPTALIESDTATARKPPKIA